MFRQLNQKTNQLRGEIDYYLDLYARTNHLAKFCLRLSSDSTSLPTIPVVPQLRVAMKHIEFLKKLAAGTRGAK